LCPLGHKRAEHNTEEITELHLYSVSSVEDTTPPMKDLKHGSDRIMIKILMTCKAYQCLFNDFQ